MYPPETSLIPVTVALARFVEASGFTSILGWYPYWYLGVPYQYLTGPIIPLLQVFLHNVLPGFSLFDVSYLLLILSFIASVVGWGVLAKKISGKRLIGLVVGILLIILPWRYLSALALSEASATISKNLFPFALIAFWQYYKKRNRKNAVYAILALSVLLLINTTILAIFTVGISALILAASFRKEKFRGLTSKAKKTAILVLLSLILVTVWYTPGYWITVITNPSIGGASGIKVFLRIFDLLKAAVPLVLAVIAVSFSGKIKSRLSLFSLTWVFTFLFLTVFRFIGDPDFWQDWTAWLSEIEVGLAILSSKVIYDLRFKIYDKKPSKAYYIVLATLLFPFLLSSYIYGVLNKPKLIPNSIPTGVASLEKLAEIAGDERVFLSGSTVFWANALYDLNQVRGGVDKAATHPYWDHAAFQLREGASVELAEGWLESLGVSYALIHGPSSSETYHDFRNIRKWEKAGDVVWESNGDFIVKISESSISWTVNIRELDKVSSPEGGADKTNLLKYVATKRNIIKVDRPSPNKIELSISYLEEGEGIIVAESFSRNWKATDKSTITKDPIGNMLIVPSDKNSSTITLEYKRNPLK